MKITTIVAINVIFFGLFAVVAFATSERSGDPLGYGFGTFGLAAVILSLSLLGLGPANEAGKRRPNRVGWTLLLVGMAVLGASPFILHAAGYTWNESMSSGRRSMPLWMWAGICWAAAISVYALAVRTAWRALRSSRP